MAVFEYRALARSGKKVKGIIDADSPIAARRKLRDQDLFPTGLKENFGSRGPSATRRLATAPDDEPRFQRISARELAMATRRISVLLEAGMPLSETLSSAVNQATRPALQNVLFDVRDRVNEGLPLADALAVHPRIFSPLYINMIRAGEASGTLENVMSRLVDILERQARMKSKIISSLAYPVFMLAFSLGIISFLMLVIVPRITALFERRGQELPGLTKALIATTDFIGSYWYLLIAAVLAVYFSWRYWVSRPQGRLDWDRYRLHMPIFGNLHLKLISGRFARILGTMLESGLTMMNALDVVTTIIQNRYVEKAMNDVKAGVRRGRNLAIPMEETGIFPPLLIQMIELGQRSGQIETLLKKAADTYDEDVHMAVDTMVSLMEPIIIVVMGFFIGMLVLSILLPILNMSTSIGAT